MEVAVDHEVIDEHETAPFGVRGEPHSNDDVGGVAEHISEKSSSWNSRLPWWGPRASQPWGFSPAAEGFKEDGAKAIVAEGKGEGVGGVAKEGVGEVVWCLES